MNALKCIRSKSEYLKEGIELLDNITAKLNEDMSYLEVMGLEEMLLKYIFQECLIMLNGLAENPE